MYAVHVASSTICACSIYYRSHACAHVLPSSFPRFGYYSPFCWKGCLNLRDRRARAATQAANNRLGSELVNVAPAGPVAGGGATHGKPTATPTMVEIPTTPTTAPPPMSTGGDAGATKKEAAGGGAATTTVPAPVAAARELFATMDGNITVTDREIKATLVKGAAQVLGGSLVLDRATVIALGEELEVVLMELGREWPNSEFRGLLSAMAVLADSE